MSETDFSKLRILVTNDDGIHAPGISALERIARALTDDVWVVAPEVEQSATSHSLTLRRPVRLRRFTDRRYAVDGTPTDCVVVGVAKVCADKRPDLVLSGINHGQNLAEDIGYSGTVAAAMEGAILGIRSIAMSQVRSGEDPIDFATAEAYGPSVIRRVFDFEGWRRDFLINVNFPAVPPERMAGIEVCRQGRRDETIGIVEGRDPMGRAYLWIGDWGRDRPESEEHDLGVVAQGKIAVTPLHLDLTHEPSLLGLEARFA